METVKTGITGILFQKQTMESLISALRETMDMHWDHEKIKHHVEQWSVEKFDQGILDVVKSVL